MRVKYILFLFLVSPQMIVSQTIPVLQPKNNGIKSKTTTTKSKPAAVKTKIIYVDRPEVVPKIVYIENP